MTEKDLNNGDTIRKLTPPKDVEVPTAPDAVLNAETTTEEVDILGVPSLGPMLSSPPHVLLPLLLHGPVQIVGGAVSADVLKP